MSDDGSRKDGPPWHYLPRDPRAFFGLPESFDRKQLKRAYRNLIRVYKPDRAPEEFQRIRAAYERLASELEGGRRFDIATPTIEPQPAVDVNSDQAEPATGGIRERLAREGSQALHRHLAGGNLRSPRAYLTLALLSDRFEPSDPFAFPRHLMDGLDRFPNHPGLTKLLRSWYRSNLPAASVPGALRLIAERRPASEVFISAMPLWDALARSAPFETVAEVLSECEKASDLTQIDARAIGVLRLTRRMLMSAEIPWLEKRLEFLEEHHAELPDSLQDKIELLELLLDYRRSRDLFLNGNALRQRIDHLIAAYCEMEVGEFWVRFTHEMAALLDQEEELAAALPRDSTETPAALEVLAWMNGKARISMGITARTTEAEPVERSATRLILDQLEKARRSAHKAKIRRASLHVAVKQNTIGWVCILAATAALLQFFPRSNFFVTLMPFALLGQLLLIPRFKARSNEFFWKRHGEALAPELYDSVWRVDVLRYLRRFRTTVEKLADSLYCNIGELNTDEVWVADALAEEIKRDPVARLYADLIIYD